MKSIRRKTGIVCLVATICLGFLAGCTSTPETAAPSSVTVTDQLGRTVTLPATPRRIVSLAPSNTEILYALGLADKMVGVTDYCNYPPEVKEKPSIGGFSTPNIEEVVAKSPDLVLATEIHKDKVIPQLETRGLTVVAANPKTIDDVIASINLIGRVTGAEKATTALLSDIQERFKAVTDKTSGLSEGQKPRVLYVVWHDPLMIAGSGTLHDELIDKAGGINIGHALTGYSKDFSLENVIMANPEVIIAGIGMGSGEDKSLQFLKTDERLRDNDARKNGRIYPINTDLIGRAGPRLVEAMEQFAHFIHPEIFQE